MANEEQLSILRQGVDVWNRWRAENHDLEIDLTGVDLSKADLHRANLEKAFLTQAHLADTNLVWSFLRGARLHGADLTGSKLNEADLNGAHLVDAKLSKADLCGADLRTADLSGANFIGARLKRANLGKANLTTANLAEADLSGAILVEANLSRANLTDAKLTSAYLSEVNLEEAQLSRADLSGASLRDANLRGANLNSANLVGSNLSGAVFVRTNINKAKVSRSLIYAVNVWDLEGEFEEQHDLVIEQRSGSVITVDNMKVAQFVYLILNNKELRDVINTLTSKTVLILGRFAPPERKIILDALRTKLREYNLLPIVFDFERPTDKDFTETIKTLAGISYFVIADITNPKSSPLELQATVPDYQIPFVPIIQEGESPFAMMVDLQKKYPWALPTKSYDSIETLMSALKPGIIDPAVEMRNKLRLVKAQEHPTESLRDYLDKTL